MTDLLESLDSAIFTPELKAEIQTSFASKLVEVKDSYEIKLSESAEALALSEAKIQEIEEKLAQVEEHAEAYGARLQKEFAETLEKALQEKHNELTEAGENYAELVAEEKMKVAEEYTEYLKEELIKGVSSYIDQAVTEYIEANRVVIDESVQALKATALIEGFDTVLETAGHSIIELQESIVDRQEVKVDEIKELKAKLDSLIKENAELKDTVKTKEKELTLESISKDLTPSEKDKFDRLADMIPFNESYKASLERIAKEVKAIKEEPVVESTIIVEDTKTEKTYSRFI